MSRLSPLASRHSNEFGHTRVTPTEKTQRVQGVFQNIARNYDIMNDAMSLGLHRLWKRGFVTLVQPRAGEIILDVAGGTGDIARLMHTASHGATNITVCDLTENMVRVGRDRLLDKNGITDIQWSVGNAENLPFPDHHFDVYTIAFGLRNVTHLDKALREARRVLKPTGRFYCLEFSRLPNAALQKLYSAYSHQLIPRLGQLIAKDKDSYQYLVESIERFPAPDALCNLMRAAGFTSAQYRQLSGGIVAVHWG